MFWLTLLGTCSLDDWRDGKVGADLKIWRVGLVLIITYSAEAGIDDLGCVPLDHP